MRVVWRLKLWTFGGFQYCTCFLHWTKQCSNSNNTHPPNRCRLKPLLKTVQPSTTKLKLQMGNLKKKSASCDVFSSPRGPHPLWCRLVRPPTVSLIFSALPSQWVLLEPRYLTLPHLLATPRSLLTTASWEETHTTLTWGEGLCFMPGRPLLKMQTNCHAGGRGCGARGGSLPGPDAAAVSALLWHLKH